MLLLWKSQEGFSTFGSGKDSVECVVLLERLLRVTVEMADTLAGSTLVS